MRKVLFFLLAGFLLSWGAYYCADTGFYYSDRSFCDSVCSNSCEVLLASDQGLTCDTVNYELFIYNPQTNKTIAITKSSDFWDQFSGLLVVEDASDNEAGRQILSYLNTTAWIGLYDPDLSPSYNSVNLSRFMWWDGTPVSYANWNTGEPDNRVDTQDIGSVSPLGEHWVYMDAGGMWSDDGLHLSYGGDYRPRRRALVMWRQQLDCVNGLPQNDRTTTNDMINLYCSGQTPCYLCTDGTDIQACGSGDAFVGSYRLEGSGRLSEVVFSSPLSGTIRIRGTGFIDYCYAGNGCPRYDGEALLSWVVFRGSDGNYYWLGNPDGAPVCAGTLSLRVLDYTTDTEGNFLVNVPYGVQLVSLIDVESLSGLCTGDNVFNFSLTVLSGKKEWLCPIQNSCVCPNGSVWDGDLKKCAAEPDLSCGDASYTLDTAAGLCVSSPLCPEGGYNSSTNRCEVPPASVCPSGSFYDSSLDVCFSGAVCSGEYTFNAQNDRCELPAAVTCSKGTFNQQTGRCEFAPDCPPGSTYVNGRCEKAPTAACGIGTYDPADNRFEWSPVCSVGTYNPAQDRCEISANCPAGSMGSSGLCETSPEWACPPNYAYNPSNGKCEYIEVMDATPVCPAGYTYNSSTGFCEASPLWVCVLEKSGCVSPPQRFSCTGGSCSAGGFNFGASCEVDPGCGVLAAGQSCSDDSSPACTFTNYSYQVCPDGSVSAACQATPSYSCPSGYTLVGTTCQKLYTQDASPSCPPGFTYDSTLQRCTAVPDCPAGTNYDQADGVCWAEAGDAGCGGANYDPAQDVCWTGWFYLCDEGFNFDASTRTCWTDPVCSDGLLVNGVCQVAPETNCGSDAFDSSRMVCYRSPECPALFSYSSLRDRCERPAERTCSVGTYDPVGDVCFFDPSCAGSGVFNASGDRCEMDPQRSCGFPFVFDSSTGTCVAERICEGMTACVLSETCPSGGVFDAAAGVCALSAVPECPSGGTYSSSTDRCEASPVISTRSVVLLQGQIGGKAICVDPDPDRSDACGKRNRGTLELTAGSEVELVWSTCCVCDDDWGRLIMNISGVDADGNSYGYTYDRYCPSGGRSLLTDSSGTELSYDVAYYDTWGWDEVTVEVVINEPVCPDGYIYDGRVCTAQPLWNCPADYIYNPVSGRCEAPLDISMTCPLDPSLPCIQGADGNYYCTQNTCIDAASTPPVNTDTRQGANDVPADGQVTEEGCVGTVYVFNGRDMRCRPPGTQTGFSNCCRKTTTWFGLGRCSEAERQLASLRSWGQLDGNCHYVGEYCAEEWFDVCVQKKKTYCCFSSPLARIIHEQGRPQLGIGWGTPESPNCRGFTMQEFQKLDFSKMDFSEWVEEEVRKNIAPNIETNIQNVINQIPSQIQSQ